jgi:hypothetical protein
MKQFVQRAMVLVIVYAASNTLALLITATSAFAQSSSAQQEGQPQSPPSADPNDTTEVTGSEPFNTHGRRGKPLDPMEHPIIENNPHAWLEFLGYYAEMSMLGSALAFLLGAVDLAILRRILPAFFLAIFAVGTAVVGLAMPGLLIIVDHDWVTTDSARWLVVHGLQIAWFLLGAIMFLAPIVISWKRRQNKKRKILVGVVSALCVLLSPLLWPAAIHLALTEKKAKTAETALTENAQDS